jgi:hypothetical protein
LAQYYVVPAIYRDLSDQSRGFFAFRFTCQQCSWSIDTSPIRSKTATATNVLDIGVGLLGGFWGRAAEAGEMVYGSKYQQEHAEALQRAWQEIQHEFHYCPKCFRTVCMRCFNTRLNLCVACAPDLKADAAAFVHEKNVEEQRRQIEEQYEAPRFNVAAVPSAVTPDMLKGPAPGTGTAPARGPLQQVACPLCRQPGIAGKFCQNCGARLPMVDLVCPHCSQPVEPTARFCPECGTKLQQAI